MADYTKGTGSSGTMMIRDTGSFVEFWLRAGSGTFIHEMPWAYTVNGYSSSWKEFDFQSGGDWQRIDRWSVTHSQTVTFKLGKTNTGGLGGPTTLSVWINRASAPSPPSAPVVSSITPSTAIVTFTDGNNNGSPIDLRQVGYGLSSGGPSTVIDSANATYIEGLSPGTTYFVWARARNARGFSDWSGRTSFTTISGARIKVGTEWKTAVVYVNVDGVWKIARPWGKTAGVWKETA